MRGLTTILDDKAYMLDLAIYNIHRELTDLGDYAIGQAHFGYECKEDKEERFEILCSLLPILKEEQIRTSFGGGCLTTEETFSLLSKHIVLFEEGARADLETDRSGLPLWIALNPDSVPRKKWEQAACDVACEYDIVIDVSPVKCEYDLSASRTIPDCDLELDFVAAHKECNIEFQAFSFKEQCAYDFDVLLADKDCEIGFEVYKKTNGCELDLDQYVCLRECNLDATIIRTVLAAGCTINVGES